MRQTINEDDYSFEQANVKISNKQTKEYTIILKYVKGYIKKNLHNTPSV